MGHTGHPIQFSHRPAQWIHKPEELRDVAAHLGRSRVIALDSESDSLHHFPEKVCLVQLAGEEGAVFLVDPLALGDLSPLGPICASPNIVKVLHGASYDLASLKRDFGFAFAGIFDTMVAAQFLGRPSLGLASLLEAFFGIAPGRSRQKDDWAKRPLIPDQEAYAAQDVRYLIPLRERLLQQLQARGRETWVEEECRALADIPAAERTFDPDGYLSLKGTKSLDRHGLAVLRELFALRDAWAREMGRPPFKVLSAESLIRLSAARPGSRAGLLKIAGCSPKVVARLGDGLLAAIARGQAVPEAELPTYPRRSKPQIPPAVQRRIEALTRWRANAAERLGLEPGVVLPRRLIERLAEDRPDGREGLASVDGHRRWRAEVLGQEILEVLASLGPPGDRRNRPRAKPPGGPAGR